MHKHSRVKQESNQIQENRFNDFQYGINLMDRTASRV